MKIEQKPEFQPITITIESDAEALALWEIVGNQGTGLGNNAEGLCREISNWLSNNSQLG